ncbi:hypothetical protein XH94_23340 [Bradyrhizobium zhanjiangense]|uniref:Uncharacterized protein n=1 Tax=Bradyrhizobium zhanjiangense TaxID=1325107 RepID=A0A4V1L3J6_9BRAD|nr:hypothetical protein XH94_23340 [Bradyrhizobium zhanjiangense]
MQNSETDDAVPNVPLHESAIIVIFEISKVLTAPYRLEVTLANVVDLLQSFVQMRHGIVSLFHDEGVPDITVGAGWSEGSDERFRMRLPQKVIDEIVASDRQSWIASIRTGHFTSTVGSRRREMPPAPRFL